MLPEVAHLNNYERNVVYSGIIAGAIDIAKAGALLSPVLQNDLIELEDRLKTEVANTALWRHPHPITLQNLGRISTLWSQGTLS
jgi:hypothetical protein